MRKILAILTGLAALLIAVPASAAPATHALGSPCTFGNYYYEFVSDYVYDQGYYNGQIIASDAVIRLNIDTDGSWFCQVVIPGLQGSEWKSMSGNDLCMTWNYDRQYVDVVTCYGLPSQGWQLYDNRGNNALGANWGGMYSDYTNHGRVWLAMNSTNAGTPDTTFCCWDGADVYGWTLDPY